MIYVILMSMFMILGEVGLVAMEINTFINHYTLYVLGIVVSLFMALGAGICVL